MLVYATREDVKDALNVASTARSNGQIDRAIASASRSVEGLTHRKFYPQTGIRYFDWPERHLFKPWRLWLDDDEVITVDTLVAGGVTIPDTDYFLEPANTGPPFSHIEIDLASDSEFANVDTHQRAIEVTGVFGYTADEETIGELAANLAADATATASVTFTTARIGVGNILRINDERMVITRRTMVDSTQNIGADLTASQSDVTVAVTDGTAFAEEAVLLIDSERMLVIDVAGNNLTVKRAWDGSVLAAHTTGADVFTLTGIELDRAQLGTTLAAHTSGDPITRHVVPGLVRELTIAEALNTVQQEQSGYARAMGAGETERILVAGRGLEDIRIEARRRYGRRLRPRVG